MFLPLLDFVLAPWGEGTFHHSTPVPDSILPHEVPTNCMM